MMEHLKLHYAKAVNILCFGPEGIEIHFSDFGNLVQIKGYNLDTSGPDDDPGSNGVGKSSVQEVLSIALFGRTVKETKKCKGGHFINVLADHGMVEVQWDNFRVVRTFRRSKSGTVTSKIDIWESPDRIWDNNSKVSRGEANQEWINDRVRLNHFAFCNVVIFDDSDVYAFLESDTPTRREFVENLLGLEEYKQYCDNAKAYLKEQKQLVDKLNLEYRTLSSDIDAIDLRIETVKKTEVNWKESKKTEMRGLMTRIQGLQEKLKTTSMGEQLSQWQTAQERIAAIDIEIESKENRRVKTTEVINEAHQRLQSVRENKNQMETGIQKRTLELNALHAEMQEHQGVIRKLESLEEGTKCTTCHGVITKDNFDTVLLHSKNIIEGCQAKIIKLTEIINKEKQAVQEKKSSIEAGEKGIKEAEASMQSSTTSTTALRKERNELAKISKPDADSNEKILENQIVELKRQLLEKKSEFEQSPYREILDQAELDKTNKQQSVEIKGQEIQDAEKKIPYFEFWVYAFGDKGIRKYIVDGVIPALNDRASYWLGYLTDGVIQVAFDNELEHVVTRKGNSAYYPSMSKGEKRKVNLAVSQAFAYVMTLNYGTCPYQIFLDEVTGGGIDRASTVGVYSMILELAKERQVFVTTHNENLLSMLQGCETICLQKQNDVTLLLN